VDEPFQVTRNCSSDVGPSIEVVLCGLLLPIREFVDYYLWIGGCPKRFQLCRRHGTAPYILVICELVNVN